MTPLPTDRGKALSLLFRGYSARSAADELNLSNVTISTWLKDFTREAEEAGNIMAAAERYGIEEQVRQLIEIGGVIERTKVNPANAKDGLEVVSVLMDLGVKPEEARDFIKAVNKEAERQHLPPENLVKTVKSIYDLGVEDKRDYRALLDEVETMRVQLETLKNQVSEYEGKSDDSRRSTSEALESSKVTLKDLDRYTALRVRLASHGLNLDDLDKVESCAVNVAEQGYDSAAVISAFSRGPELKRLLEEQEAKALELSAANEKAAEELEEKSRFLELNTELAEQVEKVNRLGFNANQLDAIVEAAHAVAARHGLSQRESLQKLEGDLTENWEPKLGFENEVTRLQVMRQNLSEEINEATVKLGQIKAETTSKRKPLDELEKIKKLGVAESELPDWSEALEASGSNLQTFRKEVKRLGGIKQYVDSREAELSVNLKRLEDEERKRRTTLSELANQETMLRTRIDTLLSETMSTTTSTLNDLKETAETVNAASRQLKSEFDDPETGLKAKSKEITGEVSRDWREEAKAQVKTINQTGESVKNGILEVADKVDKAMEEVFEAGKAIGQYGFSRDLLMIIKGEEVDRLTGLTTLASALMASGDWLQTNGMVDLARECNSLARGLEGRMKK